MAGTGQTIAQKILTQRQEAFETAGYTPSIGKIWPSFTDSEPLLGMPTPKDIPIHPPPGDCDVDKCNTCPYQYDSEDSQKNFDACAYESAVTDEEAAHAVDDLVNSIRENRAWLQERLETHGDNFLRRWKKTTQTRRKAIIGRVDGLEPNKWPQLTWMYARDDGWPQKRVHRNAFLVPHLNVESLAEEKSRILSLLSNRTNYGPDELFHMDRGMMEMGLVRPLLGREFNRNCVNTTQSLYGYLQKWDKEPVHRGEAVGYPVAKLVLEAQSITMRTLRTIVEAVLEGVQIPAGNAEWQAQEQEGFKPTEPQIGSSILEGPYGPPPSFDPQSVHDEITRTTLESYEDELSALQCDPGYAQLRVRELRTSKIFNALSSDNRWAWISFFVYAFEWFAVIAWVEVLHSATPLIDAITNAYVADPDGDFLHELPDWYVTRMQDFENVVSAGWIARSSALNALLSCKGFEDYCDVHKPTKVIPVSQGRIKPEFTTISARRKLFSTDPLVWALLELACRVADVTEWLNRGLLLAFLSDLLREKGNRKRIDRDVQEVLTDLNSLWSIWRDMHLQRPFHERRRPDVGNAISDPGQERRRGLAVSYVSSVIAWNLPLWKTTGALLRAFSEASWPKGKRDLEWLKRAAETRNRLRGFWDSWREHWRDMATGRGKRPEVWENYKLLPELRYLKFDLTAAYRDDWEALEASIKADDAADRKRKASSAPLEYVTPSFPAGSEVDTSASPKKKQKKKIKKKTRPEQPVPEAEPEPEPVPVPASPERPPIFVKKGSLDVFARMWPDQSGNIKEGTIRWVNVLSAMTDAGCSTWQNDGSSVNFQWLGEAGERHRLQAHRPHDDGDNADASLLTRMGFRLTRRFGWKWKHFVERPRGEGAEGV